MALFKVTVEVLVEAEGVCPAEDNVSEALLRNVRNIPEWKDWRYSSRSEESVQEITEDAARKQFPDYRK